MESLYTLLEKTSNEINRFEDPRTKDWYLMSSPVPTLILSMSYYWIVTFLLPTYMKNRKPFQLKKTLMAYNCFQVILSIWMFYVLIQCSLRCVRKIMSSIWCSSLVFIVLDAVFYPIHIIWSNIARSLVMISWRIPLFNYHNYEAVTTHDSSNTPHRKNHELIVLVSLEATKVTLVFLRTTLVNALAVCAVALPNGILYCMGKLAWFGKYSYKCQPVSTYSTPESNKMVQMAYFYFISKFVEFFDTGFFVLRKKFNQVSPLHVFHHGVMPLGSWLCVKYAPDGNMTIICFVNSFVHAIMYSYYLLSALGPKVQKYLWWKKYITVLQLVQFVVIMAHSMQSLVFGCNFPKPLSSYIVVQSLIFFYLFSKFYQNSYKKNNQSVTANGSALKKSG